MLKQIIQDNQNLSYKPSSQEITNFKKNNILSNTFKNNITTFIKELNKEIEEFKNIDDNINIISKNEEIKFYSQTEDYFEFSPFYISEFNFGGIKFNSSEQMYDFIKVLYSSNDFENFENEILNIAFKILIQSKPMYCYNYAKKIDESIEFNKIKVIILYICNKYKFINNQELINKLKETNNQNLIWNNKFSSELGIGKNGKGKNIFGIVLMTLRNNL